MFCAKCGTELPDDSQFCRKCGNALSTATATGAGTAAAPAPIPAKPKQKIRTSFKVGAVLAVVFVAYLFYQGSNRNSASSHASPIDQIVKQQHTMTVNNPSFPVKAVNYSYYKLEVPPGATSVHLQGSFTATGGSGNDIEAYLLRESDFVNWQNRHSAKTFYNSGKVTVGNISIDLPSEAATYYLVFDNRFSLLSQKSIQVNASLTYYQ